MAWQLPTAPAAATFQRRASCMVKELLARVMLRVAEKHGDPAMRAAGVRLAKAARAARG